MREQRLFTITTSKTDHHGVTDPIRKRPTGMSRRAWRALVRKGYRVTRKQELVNRREEAALPESVKLDRRLHAAGLLSPRDLGRILPVEFNIVGA